MIQPVLGISRQADDQWQCNCGDSDQVQVDTRQWVSVGWSVVSDIICGLANCCSKFRLRCVSWDVWVMSGLRSNHEYLRGSNDTIMIILTSTCTQVVRLRHGDMDKYRNVATHYAATTTFFTLWWLNLGKLFSYKPWSLIDPSSTPVVPDLAHVSSIT